MSWKATAFVKELREGLSVTEKFVLLMLGEYHQSENKSSWPSVATLAYDCLMTERGVQQILSRLVEGGFIKRTSGGGRGNITAYRIVGLDVKKGEPETVNGGSGIKSERVNETLHSHSENPAQPCVAIRKERVLTNLEQGEGLNSTEIAFALCKSEGWSGLPIIDALRTGIECRAEQRPGIELYEIGTELVSLWPKYKQRKKDFAGGPLGFFQQSKWKEMLNSNVKPAEAPEII